MKKLEVEINISGYPVGTLRWFNNIIDHSKLVISDVRSDYPAIYLRTDNGDDTYIYRFLCKRATEDTNSSCIITEDGYACTYPQQIYDIIGFESKPLTPNCYRAIKELIMEAKDIFAEWWENDGKLKK